MVVKILYDNLSLSDEFISGWGFSCLIDDSILFDTGESGGSLFHNMKSMNVDISGIERMIISHDHWDHTGGMTEVLKKRPNIRVYICPNFSESVKDTIREHKGELIQQDSFEQINGNVFVTGEIQGQYKGGLIAEQALAMSTPKGLTVLTGCAHPGILTILEVVKEQFPDQPIHAVLGGFHLMKESQWEIKSVVEKFKAFDVKRAGPAHCSGQNAIEAFKRAYGDDFIEMKAGRHLEV